MLESVLSSTFLGWTPWASTAKEESYPLTYTPPLLLRYHHTLASDIQTGE
jgi:hypothetical protein